MHLDYAKIFNSIRVEQEKETNIKSGGEAQKTVSHMFPLDENVHFIDSRIYTQPLFICKAAVLMKRARSLINDAIVSKQLLYSPHKVSESVAHMRSMG